MLNTILIHLAAALIPLFVGFIYYSPKVAGNIWMREAGVTAEKLKSGNMLVILLLTFFLSFVMSFLLGYFVDHTMALMSIFTPMESEGLGMDPNAPWASEVLDAINEYRSRFGTFEHGAFHGVMIATLFALPVIAINALFERRSGKYIFLHWGYWIIALALMGGVLCQWA